MGAGILNLNGIASSVTGFVGTSQSGGIITGGATLTVTGGGAYDYAGRVTDTTSGGATIRYNGTGSLTLSGTADNSGGRASVNNGVLVLGKASTGGVHAVGTNNVTALSVTGGTARLGGTGGDQIYTDSNVEMTGGTFDLNARSEGFRGLTGTGGNIRNDGALGSLLTVGEGSVAGNNYSFAGTITNGNSSVGLTKTGLGTQTLTGTNTYSGNTTVNSGTLALGSGGSISGSSTITVAANATLDVTGTGGWTVGAAQTLTGNGTLVGNATIGGDLRPGSSPGALSVTGDLGLNSGSEWFVEIGGTAPAAFDRLLVSGNLNAGGSILVSLVGGFNPAVSDSFQIASFGSLTNSGYTFNFTGAPLDAGFNWDASQFATTGTLTVIPEPSVAWLGVLGALALIRRRR
jgi:autotransporter-associated beta strand protein